MGDFVTNSRIQMLGVPWDANSSYLRGAAQAPAAIRDALRCDASNGWAESGIDTSLPEIFGDAGDLEFGDGENWFSQTENAAEQLARKCKPLFLGGDHSVTYPLVRGVAKKFAGLTMVHFDAHPDLYENYEDNPYSHASPFARILEEKLAVRLIQVGIRTLNAHQKAQAEKFGVEVCERKAGSVDLVAMKIQGPVYVSFDLDALDPAFAPGVSHREPGGLSVREAIGYLHSIPATVVAADLVELNPTQDISGVSATVCAKLVKELVGVMAR